MALSIESTGELFEQVQLQNVLGDGKTFPDCIPKFSLEEILEHYRNQKSMPEFQLQKFVLDHFELPTVPASDFKSDITAGATTHVNKLWDVLTRQPVEEQSSLITLPHSYVVPGGRFREIYYWDSYFTMLGLKASGKKKLIENMIKNFSFLIHQFGYIPNGNRSYFLGRSQPPFFSLMIRLWSEVKGSDSFVSFLPSLEREYSFWMNGSDQLTENLSSYRRVIRMPDGFVMNRYWDDHDTPRPESFKEDVELARTSSQSAGVLYRHLRAAAESGWDFSSRWFKIENEFATIHTTDIVPVDLNCLLHHLENTLAEAYQLAGNRDKSSMYTMLAEKRKKAIRQYCWNPECNFYTDFDFVTNQLKNTLTLAGAFPLFFQVASPDQAMAIAELLEHKFLKHGGLTTTLRFSGQQWDAPNGWAPLQWICYKGLQNYGFDDLASEISKRWISMLENVFSKTGKMTEKYNVWDENSEGGGGEYPNQDGFGWTNGVFQAMKQ